MPEAKDQHQQAVVFEFADEPVITDPVFPEFAHVNDVVAFLLPVDYPAGVHYWYCAVAGVLRG